MTAFLRNKNKTELPAQDVNDLFARVDLGHNLKVF